MTRRSNRSKTTGKDPSYVHTSPDGRKYIKPNEIVHLDKFKQRMDRLRDAVKDSRLVRES